MVFTNWFLRKKKHSAPKSSEISPYLEEMGLSFYNALSGEEKEAYQKRCHKFIQDKRFISEAGGRVDVRSKIRIAAKAVQLSFGLSNFYFREFHTIRLREGPPTWNEGYEASKSSDLEKGELWLTVPDKLDEAFSASFDALLFELALGLHPSLDIYEEFETRFAAYLDQWEKQGLERSGLFNEEAVSVFTENETDPGPLYFALVLERFFSDPDGVREHAAYLYYFYAFILVRDPEASDRKFTKSLKQKIQYEEGGAPTPYRLGIPSEKRATRSWMVFLGGGLLLGTGANIYFHAYTLISWKLHFLLGFLIAIPAAFIQYDHLVREHEIMNKYQFFPYCLLGTANLILGLIFFLNYNLILVEQERLAPFEKVGHAQQGRYTVVRFPEKYHEMNDARLTVFVGDHFYSLPQKPNGLRVHFGWGIFGMKTVQDRKLVTRKEFEN
ncbi:MAG: zinc-dependent peptidase [Flavobacteriales bacterium]